MNTPFWAVIQVPLIIKTPGVAWKRKFIDKAVELVDIVPTILDFCGIEKPSYMEGESLIPLMKGKKWAPKHAYSKITLRGKSAQSLIKENYHLIYVKFGVEEKLLLFNTAKDPDEIDDISGENMERAKQMYGQLKEIYRDSEKKSKTPKRVRINKDLKGHFRSLGYLQ